MSEPKGTWGGSRSGAGRKKTSPFEAHVARPDLADFRRPVELILKLKSTAPQLRNRRMLYTFRRAVLRAKRFGLRVLEYSVQKRRIHLICEFKTNDALERSLKSLCTILAIALKLRIESKTKRPHRGRVFLERFGLKLIHHPRVFAQTLASFAESLNSEAQNQSPLPYCSVSCRKVLHSARAANTPLEHTAFIKSLSSTPMFYFSRRALNSA